MMASFELSSSECFCIFSFKARAFEPVRINILEVDLRLFLTMFTIYASLSSKGSLAESPTKKLRFSKL